ncbi:MAG: hypothetical protein RLZZ347_120 [Candidatus Parcubacteria bacterium]|jgi:hypothetical protein
MSADIVSQLRGWEKFYLDVFGLTVDFSQVKIPAQREGFTRLIVVLKGLTLNGVRDVCNRRLLCEFFTDDLDTEVVVNDRMPIETYAILARDSVDSDENLAGYSAEDILGMKLVTMTLLERMLLELMCYVEGRRLDVKTSTICPGSRYADGDVAGADFRDEPFKVRCFLIQGCGPDLRAREVIAA